MSTGPDPWPHPPIFGGLNEAPFAMDQEMNGEGEGQVVYPARWDEITLPRPTVLSVEDDAGQSVDAFVQRERRTVLVPRDYDKLRASGTRGVTQ